MFVLLAGCGARLISADNEKVVITNVSKHTEGDANRIAEKACAKYRKQAFAVSGDMSSGTMTYKCIGSD